MNDLTFQPGDAEQFAACCMRARKHAKNNPVAPGARLGPADGFRFGPWNICLTYERDPSRWHASIALLEEIGSTPVQLGELVALMPQDAMVAVATWPDERVKQAKFLLGEVMAPLIVDEKQEMHEHRGLWALHWYTATREEAQCQN